jgi:hypothetical protein
MLFFGKRSDCVQGELWVVIWDEFRYVAAFVEMWLRIFVLRIVSCMWDEGMILDDFEGRVIQILLG